MVDSDAKLQFCQALINPQGSKYVWMVSVASRMLYTTLQTTVSCMLVNNALACGQQLLHGAGLGAWSGRRAECQEGHGGGGCGAGQNRLVAALHQVPRLQHAVRPPRKQHACKVAHPGSDCPRNPVTESACSASVVHASRACAGRAGVQPRPSNVLTDVDLCALCPVWTWTGSGAASTPCSSG